MAQLKKLQNIARMKLRGYAPSKTSLLKKYPVLSNYKYKFNLPKQLILGKGTQLTKFGIELLDDEPELYLNLNDLNISDHTIQISFESVGTSETQWKCILLSKENTPISKELSLRTTNPHLFSLTINAPQNLNTIKLIPNCKDCIANIYNLEIKNININELIKNDLPTSSSKHRAIICFPVIDWEYRKQRPHHLMRQLAQSGNHIIYLSTRLFGFHEERAKIENLEDRITKLTLPGNFRLNLYKDMPTERSIELGCRAIVEFLLERAFEDVVLVCNLPFWLPYVTKLNKDRGYPIVYDCMDDHAGFENNTQEMLDHEHALCEKSDLLITTSQTLFDSHKSKHPNCHLIRNAGDVNHFSQENFHNNLKLTQNKPIIGYFGALAEWFDIDAIIYSAKTHPEWSHVLIGHYDNRIHDAFKNIPNIYLLGEIDYNILPEYLNCFDICTIPFLRIPLTEATNPVKIYEYFASGKPVVSRRLPEVEIFSDITYLYDTPSEFVKMLELSLVESQTDNKKAARKEVAKNNTWVKRGQDFEILINKLEKKAAIIVISYESLPFLRACVNSIVQKTNYQNYELIIVDNASSNPVVEYLKELEKNNSKIKIILNDTNRGFAAANNQGIALAKDAEYFILLNNDTVVPSGWLKRLIYYASRPDIGIVGPVTNNIGNEAQIHTCYQNLEEMGGMSWGLRKQFQGEIFDIKVLAMFCVALRREILEKVGYLDEDFNIGMFEDDDYAQRVREKGYRVVCAEDVFVHHYGSVSFKQIDQTSYNQLFQKNKEIYEKKWGKWIPHSYR